MRRRERRIARSQVWFRQRARGGPTPGPHPVASSAGPVYLNSRSPATGPSLGRSKIPRFLVMVNSPKPRWSEENLLTAIRAVLAAAPFLGEGHRKVWARLRWQGVRTSKARVLRLMREAHLLAPTRVGHAHGPKAHDGTITTE